jgi:UDPglucose 6-dehydrogenase
MNSPKQPRSIGFVGLSHLGIVSSIAAAAQGFNVIAFDSRHGVSEALNSGRFPVREPGLEELVAQHRDRIQYTDRAEDVSSCSLLFFTLDVPTDENNRSDLTELHALIADISARAADEATLVVMSQVPPGFCRSIEQLFCNDGRRLQFFYQVGTLIFGNAIARAMRPERYIVGCREVNMDIPGLYREFLEAFDCPVLPMRYESAELCKIAINCYLVSSVSTTNMLAEICERIGAEWQEIASALRLDKRIGPHAYLSPGLGIAGGNLERDLVTIQNLAAEQGTDAGLVFAWQNNSAWRKEWALRLLYQEGLLDQSARSQLAVWGLAYKQDTHSTKNSPAIALIQSLHLYAIRAYDPAVQLQSSEFHHVTIFPSALEAAREADALVIMTPWREFSQASLPELRKTMRGAHVLDPFGVLDQDACRALGFDYHRLGS